MSSNALKWHGGKTYLAKRIIELMPPHLHYVEPFFGGGAVLFARDPTRNWYEGAPDYDGSAAMRGCSEVVNDTNGGLMGFWKVLARPDWFQQFKRRIDAMPFSQAAWTASVSKQPAIDPIVRARDFFIRYRQSRQGLGTDFATLSRRRTRRGMNEQASAWLSAIEGLPEAHARLQQVVIIGPMDGAKAIRQEDDKQTHFYCDPPYLQETRTATEAYQYEMTETQHFDLLKLLGSIKGTFQLSGYHSPMYDKDAKRFGWRCVEFDVPNNASGRKTKERKTECLWMNY